MTHKAISPEKSDFTPLSRRTFKGLLLPLFSLTLAGVLTLTNGAQADSSGRDGQGVVTQPETILIRLRALSFNHRIGPEARNHLIGVLRQALHDHPESRVILLFGSSEKKYKMAEYLQLQGHDRFGGSQLEGIEAWVLPEAEEASVHHFSDPEIFTALRLRRDLNLNQSLMLIEVLGREDEFRHVQLNKEAAHLSAVKTFQSQRHAQLSGVSNRIYLNLNHGLASSLVLAFLSQYQDHPAVAEMDVRVRTRAQSHVRSDRSLQEFLASPHFSDKKLLQEAFQIFSEHDLNRLSQEVFSLMSQHNPQGVREASGGKLGSGGFTSCSATLTLPGKAADDLP